MAKKWEINRALRSSGLPAAARLIVFTLSDLADVDTGIVPDDRSPSLRELGDWTGLGKGPVAKHLNTLEELGWVTRVVPPIHLSRTEHARTRYALSVGKTMERVPRQRSDREEHVPEQDMACPPEGHANSDTTDEACPPAGQGMSSSGTRHVLDEDKSMSSRRTLPYTDNIYDQNNQVLQEDASGVGTEDGLFPALDEDSSKAKKTRKKPPADPTLNQRIGAIVSPYRKLNPLSNQQAVFQIVKTAVGMGQWTDEQIAAALLKLHADNRVVTSTALSVALTGGPRASPRGHQPFRNPEDMSIYEGEL